MLTREDLKKIKVKEIALDGGVVHVRAMKGTERREWTKFVRALNPETDNDVDVYTYLVCRTLCDGNGVRLYGDTEAAIVAAELDAKALAAIFDAALAWNALTSVAVDAEKKD